MNVKEIYQQRKTGWDSLLQLRRGNKPQAEIPAAPSKPDAEDHSPRKRIEEICDPGSFRELYSGVRVGNPLGFPGYEEKRKKYQELCQSEDAFLAGSARIHKRKVAIGFLDGRFLMGSMGSVVGEKVTLLAEYAARKNLPLIIFSASGGARMQEGMFSLMQMAKTAAAIERYKAGGGLFLSCLTNPTTGGVSASFASLGDLILAEPGALICFAGPRVIEQTIGQKLPEGFQRSEFLLEHGMIDRIVERSMWRAVLNQILYFHGFERG